MKKLFTIFALAVCAIAFAPIQAEAQVYGDTTLLSGGTNNVATTATNTYTGKNLILDKRTETGVLLSYRGNAADTGNVTFVFQRAVEKSVADATWSTVVQRVVLAADGTNVVSVVTNLNAGAVGHLRLRYIENACTNAITNVVVKYSLKP